MVRASELRPRRRERATVRSVRVLSPQRIGEGLRARFALRLVGVREAVQRLGLRRGFRAGGGDSGVHEELGEA